MTAQTMRLSALDASRELDLYPRGITPGSDAQQLKPGILISVDTDLNRVRVSVDGSSGVWIPYIDGPYTPGDMVWVSVEKLPGASGLLCLGRVGGTPGVVLPTAPVAAESTAQAIAVIRPQWSGTWRSDQSAYDRWNAARSEYGGRATLYQGSLSPSGELVGLALYGSQIIDLGATSISKISLTLRDANRSLGPRPAMQVRAATNVDNGSVPVPSGPAMVALALARGAVTTIDLDTSLLDDFRTGVLRALATVGAGSSAYNAVRGTSDADGMALTITYTRPI